MYNLFANNIDDEGNPTDLYKKPYRYLVLALSDAQGLVVGDLYSEIYLLDGDNIIWEHKRRDSRVV